VELVPSTAASVTGKASARPELENSKTQSGQGPFRIAQIYIEAHFAGRKSLV
jgi:hypothetical protein